MLPEARHGSFLTQVNVVIVVTVDKNAAIDTWLSEHQQHIVSGACTLQNMMLAGWDLGIVSCCVTLDSVTTHKLSDTPEDQILIGSIALGYPKEKSETWIGKLTGNYWKILSSMKNSGRQNDCQTKSFKRNCRGIFIRYF